MEPVLRPISPCLGSVTLGPVRQGLGPLRELLSFRCLLFPVDNGLLTSYPSCPRLGPLGRDHTPRQHFTLFSWWLACWQKLTPPFQSLDYEKWQSEFFTDLVIAPLFCIAKHWHICITAINIKQSCEKHGYIYYKNLWI